jgi:hypothetical protein
MGCWRGGPYSYDWLDRLGIKRRAETLARMERWAA